MSNTQIGERVGAIYGGQGDTVKFLGYGVYEGLHVPEEAVGFLAEIAREEKAGNPRIRLDNGKVVYGCECWWGAEDKIKEKLAAYPNIVHVDIDELRAAYRAKSAELEAAKAATADAVRDGMRR